MWATVLFPNSTFNPLAKVELGQGSAQAAQTLNDPCQPSLNLVWSVKAKDANNGNSDRGDIGPSIRGMNQVTALKENNE